MGQTPNFGLSKRWRFKEQWAAIINYIWKIVDMTSACPNKLNPSSRADSLPCGIIYSGIAMSNLSRRLSRCAWNM